MIESVKAMFEVGGADAQCLPFKNHRRVDASRCFLRLLLAAVLVFGWSGIIQTRTVSGQGLQKIPAPIQVRVLTESDAEYITAGFNFDFSAPQTAEFVVSQGSSVVFAGKTVADGKRKDVKITVRSSAGAKNLVATVDKDGVFLVKFDATQSVGIYTVEAIAPDGAGKHETKFKVVTPLEIIEEVVDDLDEAAATTDQALAAIEDSAGKLPVSPPQAELLERTKRLKSRAGEMPEQIKKFDRAWWKLRFVLDTYPGLQPAFQPMLNKMAAETAELRNKTLQIREQLNRSKARGALCDQLETINEDQRHFVSAQSDKKTDLDVCQFYD